MEFSIWITKYYVDYRRVSTLFLTLIFALTYSLQIYYNILRGSFLRIASDLSGGTPLETIKCQTTVTKE
jgi:hypothetical protein